MSNLKLTNREEVLVALETLLGGISLIKKTLRKKPTSIEDLKRYSSGQMPLLVMLGGVPQPNGHINSQRGFKAKDIFLSALSTNCYCYFMNNTDPDTELSSLLSAIWSTCMADQSLGGLVLETTVKPDLRIASWDPYVAFRVDIIVNYYHGIGGI